MLPLSQNIDNSSTIFITNKLLKQNSQTFEKILSPFFVCNFFLTFDQSLATFFNNKVSKITNWQTFVKVLQTFFICVKFGQSLTKLLTTSANFTNVSWNFCHLFSLAFLFYCYHQFVSYWMKQNFCLWAPRCIFLCIFNICDILNLLFALSFVNLPFSLFLNAVLERKQWVKKCTLEWIENFSDF